MNALSVMAQSLSPAVIPETEMTPAELKQSLKEHEALAFAAADSYVDAERDGLQSAIMLGETLRAVRELLKPSKGWVAWTDKNFGPGTKYRSLTRQWITRCINAYEVTERLGVGSPKCAKVLLKFSSIDKLSPLLTDIVAGVDVLDADYGEPVRKTRAPKLKIVRGPDAGKDPEPADTGKGANEAAALAKREADLDRRAKVLDAKEARLNEWEASLTLREQALTEAHAHDKVTDVTAKPAPGSFEALKEAKLAADKKANDKAARSAGALVAKKAPATVTSDSTSAQKAPRVPKHGKVAKTAPSIAPETVAAIQDAAARAVGADVPERIEAAAVIKAIDTLSAGGAVDVNEVL